MATTSAGVTGHIAMLEEVARRSDSAVVLGHGGGSDCFLANLAASWLRTLGVERILLGGIACQWWPVHDVVGQLVHVVGPEFYDPLELESARPLNDYAVLVGPDARLGKDRPHEAMLAEHLGQETFVISHRGGAKGSAAGLAAVIEHAQAQLVLSVDVGSDTLSTGHETRPVQTALADHLTTAALLAQDIPTFFCLAGYGADAEMELEELDGNFSRVLRAGGLRGAIVPSPAAIEELEALHIGLNDPIGSLVAKAARGEFGLHRVLKESPWGAVAKLGPAAIPIWVMDPQIVVEEVAEHVKLIRDTTSLEAAEDIYASVGRLPETRMVRSVNFARVSQ